MTIDAISLGNELNRRYVSTRGNGWTWAEKCEWAQWSAFWIANGVQSNARSATAKIAYQNSGIEGHDFAPPAGAVAFYNMSAAGHVVTSIGNGYCINTSPRTVGQAIVNFGHSLYISRIDGYYPNTYLGWSYNDAGRGRIDVAPWAPATSPAGGQPGPIPVGRWTNYLPVPSVQRRIQQGLKNRGRYKGAVDGVWGVNSFKGIQITAKNFGYKGPIDGALGPNTIIAVQKYGARWGGYRGAIDGQAGPATWEAFARGLGV